MTDDPFVIIAFFASVFLIVLGVWAVLEPLLEARWERRRRWLIRDHNRRLRQRSN